MKNPEIMIPITKEQQELMVKMSGEIKASRIKAASFKMFGTLVLSPFSEPEDIFYIMEKEFPEVKSAKQSFAPLRISAEEDARREAAGKCSPKIDRIYAIIAKKAKLSEEECERVMKRECELAVKYVFPRNFGKSLYGDAVRSGKKTIITADTVYPRNTVVKMLSRCGYESCGELIVTNELDCTESAKTSVYSAIMKAAKFPADRVIHIGGDVEADVETPIMKGSKALLMKEVIPTMVRSGRLRGYIQAEAVYTYDTAACLALHCALGLYAAYIFDIPRNKTVSSDFCGSAYILGFAVFGCLSLLGDYAPVEMMQRKLVTVALENEDVKRGAEDMKALFERHFGDIDFAECRECALPLAFLAEHAAPLDRAFFAEQLDDDAAKEWDDDVSEPELAPVYAHKRKKNAAARLADRMFPPGSRVRNIADRMLIKMKAKIFKKKR